MAYRQRNIRRVASKSKKNLFVTIILVLIIIYATFAWVFPWFVNGIGFIKKTIDPPKKTDNSLIEDGTLAPPVINIPYEATNSGTITLLGYAAPNSQVKIYIDDELKQTTDAKEDGNFFIEDVTLSLGINNIYGKTSDKEKESLASKNIKIIYDNEKPRLEVSEPEDGKTIQGERKIKISGKTEPGVKVLINGNQTIVDSEGNFSTEKQLNDGDNIFEIKAEDLATNSTTISRKIIFTP